MDLEQRVTALELFFDLVFVFALTQVTGYIANDPTWTRLAEGLAILAVLWWAWVSYAWLGNTAASDEGTMRVVLLAAMGAMLVASLAVPRAFAGDGLVFGVAYLAVRMLHLGAYVVVARGDPRLKHVVRRLAGPVLPAVALLVLAGSGVALYLVALSTFKRRNVGSFNQPRLVAAAVLAALAAVATALPALLSLALLTLVACALIAYEVRRYAPARARIRHGT